MKKAHLKAAKPPRLDPVTTIMYRNDPSVLVAVEVDGVWSVAKPDDQSTSEPSERTPEDA